MLKPDLGEVENFVPALHFLSTDNEKITRKVGRNYLELIMELNKEELTKDPTEMGEKIDLQLDNFGKFITLVDSLVDKRIEWVLGFPEVAAFMNKRVEVVEFGTYKIGGKNGPYSERPYYKFKSSCSTEAYLGMINFYCTTLPDK